MDDRSPQLRLGCWAMGLAVLAGLAETLIVIGGFLGDSGALPDGWPIQIGVRVVVYATAFLLIALTWQRRRVARWLLLIMLGVFGLGSLLVPLIGELLRGSTLLEALGGSAAFAITRATHIVLVVLGSIALLTVRRSERDENAAADGT